MKFPQFSRNLGQRDKETWNFYKIFTKFHSKNGNAKKLTKFKSSNVPLH